jgi:hypothetical protein
MNMKCDLPATILVCLVTSGTVHSSDRDGSWRPLFNGKDLTGWDTYLGAAKRTDPTHGLNHDPDQVFTVQPLDGGPVIRISGQYFGGIITQREFSNYHLRLQFKWGQKRWPPRERDVRDSGLCYHCVGPYPNAAKYPWPRSFEFNISEHDVGEFWSIDGTTADAEVKPIGHSPDEEAAFKGWCERNGETRPRVQFIKGGQKQTFRDGGFMPGGDYEKPVGEWNSLDLYAVGDRAVHVVNGKVALILTNLRQVVNGKELPLTGGKIELQTESAEVFYRIIEIQPLDEIPADLLK